MAVFAETIHIEAAPDDVWNVAGDIENINTWLPFITEARIEGDYRYCVAGENGALRERVLHRSDDDRSYAYTILEAPMPIEFIHAEIKVSPDGSGSCVEWSTTVTPDDLAEMFRPIYRDGLETMKRKLES